MGDHGSSQGGTIDWGSELKVSVGVTNGEVVSVAERKVAMYYLGEERENKYRPAVNINMSLVDKRVYLKGEHASVVGVFQHFNFSTGEAFKPILR